MMAEWIVFVAAAFAIGTAAGSVATCGGILCVRSLRRRLCNAD